MAVYQRLRYMFFMGVQETENTSFVFSLCFSYMVYFAKKNLSLKLVELTKFY